MTGAGGAPTARLERRVGAVYFTYFGYVGIHSPYLSLFFEGAGYTIAQIGLLMAVPQALRIVAPPLWGALADRGGAAGRLLVASAAMTALVAIGLPWAAAAGQSVAMAWLALLFLASAGVTPVAEATALSIADGDAGRYGAMRLWGSIGFVLAVVAAGPLLDMIGVGALPLFLAVAAGAVVIAGLGLGRSADRPRPARAARLRGRLAEPPVAIFFVANFLMMFAHAALYVLFSLYLARHGYSKSAIGAFWAISVVAEIALFRWQSLLFARWSAATLFAFSIAIAALRFALVGVSAGALAVLVVAQLLHAITFALHHSASMALLHQWFGPSRQARAQALFVTIGYGLGGTLGGLALGTVWDTMSPETAFGCASVAAAVGSLLARRCAEPVPPDEPEDARR